ncbi:MAG: hypothetical protein NC225_07455 [Clostridium sp.]|nr:hypothetical protein [Clostridium sp.]MCM1460759.1 hypothetical protein [Bacteroides sp.]
MLIIMAVALIILFVLYKVGDKLQKKQMAQKEQIAEAAQPATMLIIDKKILPLKDANLPKMVMEQTPKRYQKAKLPIVKAKVGPQIMNFICDEAIFEDVPVKGEVKAMISGIYIISVKSVRGRKNNQPAEEENGKKKKKSFRAKMVAKQAEYQKQLNEELLNKKQNKPKEKSKEEIKKEKERAKKIKDGLK